MANTVIFQNARIWRNDVQTENGEYSYYSVGVSSKKQDGSYVNSYMPIYFAKSAEAPAKISNGTVADMEGFLSAKERKNGRNEVQFIVTKFNSQEVDYPSADDDDIPDSFAKAESDIPF